MENIKAKQGSPSHASRSRLFEELILKSWWTLLFFLICFFAFDRAMLNKTQEENKLRNKLQLLEVEKQYAMMKQEDLQLQLNSLDDEGFIELILMRRLGLVPEGQTKLHFILPQ